MKVIKAGDQYTSPMIYGWAEISHTIMSRNGDTVQERQIWRAEDSGKLCSCVEEKRVQREQNGNEYIVIDKIGEDESRFYGEEEEFTSHTKGGYEIKALIYHGVRDDGIRLYTILADRHIGFQDYVVATGYNATDGTWVGGDYISDYKRALAKLKEKI